MNWFKRLCMFVFGVSGLLALVALSLTWVGPWTTKARSMLELPWYFLALEIVVCIAAVGLLVCLLLSLFYPRNPKETIVAEVSGGTITVTRSAIVSQVRHLVEDDGTCVASTVRVRMRKKGHIKVALRVTPRRPVDVVDKGQQLYAELEDGLAHVCGNSVQSISIVFNEPEQQGPLAVHVEQDEDAHVASYVPAGEEQSITVPMGGMATSVVEPQEVAAVPVFASVDVAQSEEPVLVEQETVAFEADAAFADEEVTASSDDFDAADTLTLSGAAEEA